VTGRQLTSFEQILLGLICRAPSSGYDLKRIFAVTPMGLYQPSSGTLYPALRRLEERGLVQAQVPSAQNGQSARHRRVYEATEAGRAVNLSWLRTPVEPATVARDLGLQRAGRYAVLPRGHVMPLRCPVCKAENAQGPACRRCKADLSMLFALEQKRVRAIMEARAAMTEGRCDEARASARLADHLRHDDETMELLAVTALLCGDFHEAWRLHEELTTRES